MRGARKRNTKFSQGMEPFELTSGAALDSLVSAVERDICAAERFDARSVKVLSKRMTVEQIMMQVGSGGVVVPARTSPWDVKVNTQFIESMYLGLPMTPLWFVGCKDKLHVADGAKRIQALSTFVSAGSTMRLTGTEFRHYPCSSAKELELEGRRFAELSSYLRKKLLEESISIYVVTGEIDQAIAANIVRRMTGSAGRMLLA